MEPEPTIDTEPTTSGVENLPLSSTGQAPLIVTLAPKSSTTDKVLTDEEVESLKAILDTKSVPKIAQAIRSIRPLSFEIRRQNSQAVNVLKNKPVKRSAPKEAAAEGGEESNAPPVIKKRAVRTQPTERRRPWKPERLDPSKPILQCDACGYQANRRDYMRRHQIRVHSDYRPYQCTLCDFKTTEKHDLDRHMNSKYHGGKGMHTQKRHKLTAVVKIKCDQCSYSTKSVNSILKHKQSHLLAQSQQAYQEQLLEEEEGGEPLASDEGVMSSVLADAGDSTEAMDASDAVAVMMMNDLMAQSGAD